ncbi:lactonase family protein [Lacticaseibacillus mingshuiensis]|uniref:lactonase family protein n=1 Tax=Lacticaseibacillus mingshuiensis TaxID=2799574 RepID=UPI00195232FB|nr:lactonase family protein [Lacticaseibacillus mingshuiensis]
MKQTVLLGGYTRHGGKGVYRAAFDSETGALSPFTPFITSLTSPTYMAVSSANIAYIVSAGDGEGGVAAFDLNGATPRLINSVLTPGGSPAHISLDEKRGLVFAAFYHDGRANVYKIGEDGGLTATDSVQHAGNGPRPEQDEAHVHFAALTPDDRLALVDLGNDTVTTYPVDEAGKLGAPTILNTPKGYGPRHLVFNHKRPIAYLLGELSSNLTVMPYDATTGSFTMGQTVKTIPDDYTDFNGAAAIRLSSDDRFLYASNRGYNTIVVYAVSEDGLSLTEIQQISTEGDFPRDFDLDLSETYVLAVNQKTSNGTLYQRDAATGKLTLAAKDLETPEAVNVVFLKD